jgi:hypothetical protein
MIRHGHGEHRHRRPAAALDARTAAHPRQPARPAEVAAREMAAQFNVPQVAIKLWGVSPDYAERVLCPGCQRRCAGLCLVAEQALLRCQPRAGGGQWLVDPARPLAGADSLARPAKGRRPSACWCWPRPTPALCSRHGHRVPGAHRRAHQRRALAPAPLTLHDQPTVRPTARPTRRRALVQAYLEHVRVEKRLAERTVSSTPLIWTS